MAASTITVRIPNALKQSGEAVFKRYGVTATQAVQGLYRSVSKNQVLPKGLLPHERSIAESSVAHKRELLRNLAGIAPNISDEEFEALRYEHAMERCK
jgi:addiction module RelB/DinJ family antitoxin